ncbi:uncharacterized protein LOC131623109 [Vicia villosa]|uniref:uncharacterized protein LOC131623109 n=1 Tax=Vicia villosa TaxID=3911 RepID=UPI00273B0EB0|nr:uncharacterized protein LOC131623109 [Vicia villosa]
MVPIKKSCSWILKNILQQRDQVKEMQPWKDLVKTGKFAMKNFYYAFLDQQQKVPWRKLFYGNVARPRALFTLRIACHDSLATKARLRKFGMLSNDACSFCEEVESLQHLFYECRGTRNIWQAILKWMDMHHTPQGWTQELQWVIENSKNKSWKAQILKVVVAEASYEIWNYRNDNIFADNRKEMEIDIERKIIDSIVNRVWMKPNLRKYIAQLIMP